MLEKKNLANYNNRLWFNIAAGLIDIIIFFLGIYMMFFSNKFIITNLYYNIKILNFNFTVLKLATLILALLSFIVHVYGFKEANNNGVYNVGNVLGIAANSLMILKLGNFKVFTIVIYFIAALFSLAQRKLYL